jgi:ABC-2 type transport system ATP-binding protein
MTSNNAIEVKGVTKSFLLPHQRASTLKSRILHPIKRTEAESQLVLNDLSIDVKQGEFFGIVGRNGSGKSTLLKCIAGVYVPEKGTIKVNGTLVPFIELGVGFNNELSGRDNIYLNASLLGFKRREVDKIYDKIVEFSELEDFMDQKLKNYSSGMQVRLAFSIAIQAKGDILILDEVLAVGDAAFKQKCNDYFYDLKADKKTVILVSHSMGAVKEFCDRALLLEKGKIVKTGSPQKIAYLYEKENKEVYLKSDLKNQHEELKRIYTQRGVKISLRGDNGEETNGFSYGDVVNVLVEWKNPEVKNVGVALYSKTGKYVFGANTYKDGAEVNGLKVSYKLELKIADGSYVFKIGLFGDTSDERIDFIDNGPSFLLNSFEEKSWGGLVELNRSWNTSV